MPSWRDDELTALTGRLRRVGPGIATVSADAPPLSTNIRNVPKAHMPSVYAGETIIKDEGEKLTYGVLQGASVHVPPPGEIRTSLAHTQLASRGPDGRVIGTISFVDTAHPSRRHRDPVSVEAVHKKALQNDPTAFNIVSSFATRYYHHATGPQRHMLPVQGNHQRLTALEDTLSRMQLHSGRASDVPASVLHAGDPGRTFTPASTAAASSRGVSTLGVGSTIPRFNGVDRPTSTHGATGRRGATRSAGGLGLGFTGMGMSGGGGGGAWGSDTASGGLESDRSLHKALTWRPASVPAGVSDATVAAVTSGRTLATAPHFAVPGVTPLLATAAEPAQYLSRSSSRGINPRTRQSALDLSLEALVADMEADAAAPGGIAQPPSDGSRPLYSTTGRGVRGFTNLTPGQTGAGGGARGAGLATTGVFALAATPMRGEGGGGFGATSTGGMGGGGASRSNSPTVGRAVTAGSSAGSSVSGGGEGRWEDQNQTGGSGDGSGTKRAPLPPVNLPHELKWIGLHPRDTMVTRLPDGAELVRTGVLQARHLERQNVHMVKDLTHGFVDQGTWNTLNLMGNTASPRRRPLNPSPTRNNNTGGGAGGLQPPAGPNFDDPGAGIYAVPGTVAAETVKFADGTQGFAASGVTPFGDVQQPRQPSGLAEAPGGEDALRKANQPLLRTADFSAELHQIDSFEQKLGITHKPQRWAKKTLISKIKASGLPVTDVGFPDMAALEAADHETLRAAYDRLPSAARKRNILGFTERPRSDMSTFTVRLDPASSTARLAPGGTLDLSQTAVATGDHPRVAATGRGMGMIGTGPASGVYHDQPQAAYTAGVDARFNPPAGRRHFATRQGDATGPLRVDHRVDLA